MPILNRLLYSMQHCEDAALHFCNFLQIKITRTTLKTDLLEHPDYPSLVALGDVFGSYGIANEAVGISAAHLHRLPLPFIAHIKGSVTGHDLFAPVYNVDDRHVEFYNPGKGARLVMTREQFSSIYNNAVLLAEADRNSGEKGYEENLKKEKRREYGYTAMLLAIPVITLLACALTLIRLGLVSAWPPLAFTLLSLAGCVVAGLLVWTDIDKHNPVIGRLCRINEHSDCSSVLDSGASTFFGLSWSSIGLSWFLGILLSLLTTGIVDASVLAVLSCMSALASPYILFSVYYQWRVAKKWCVLCLAVQAILLLQLVTAYAGGLYAHVGSIFLSFRPVLTIVSIYLLVLIAVLALTSAWQKVREVSEKAVDLQRFKHDPATFGALLSEQRPLRRPTDGLGITIGRPEAKNKIIKICSPYCAPCAKAHPVVGQLLETHPDSQLQIIFTASGDDDDRKTLPVEHFLALAAKNDDSLLEQALDDWYNAPDKNYTTFSGKYPLDTDELASQNGKVREMRKWCEDNGVSATPTFYINGYRLPKRYTVADLKYFLTT